MSLTVDPTSFLGHSSSSSSSFLKIMSWNLLAHPYTKHAWEFHGASEKAVETEDQCKKRHEQIRALLEAHPHDLYLFQEVDGLTDEEHPPILDNVLPPTYERFFYKLDGLKEGVAIGWNPERLKAVKTRGVDLGEDKAAALVLFDSGLLVATMHLKGGPKGPPPVKCAQVKKVLEAAFHLDPTAKTLLMAGDMNEAKPLENGLDQVFDSFGMIRVPSTRPTFRIFPPPTDPVDLTLDHLYVSRSASGSFSCQTLGSLSSLSNPWTHPESCGSDHLPISFNCLSAK